MTDPTLLDNEAHLPNLDNAGIGKINYLIEELNAQLKYVRQGRNALYFIVALLLLAFIHTLTNASLEQIDRFSFSTAFGLLIAFACCAFFVRQHASIALGIGLLLYIPLSLPSYTFAYRPSPVAFLSSGEAAAIRFLINVFLTIYLAKGLYGATQVKRILAELQSLNAPIWIKEQSRRLKKIVTLSYHTGQK